MESTLRNFMMAGEYIEVACPMADRDDGFPVGAAMDLNSELECATIGLFAHGGRLFLWLDGDAI